MSRGTGHIEDAIASLIAYEKQNWGRLCLGVDEVMVRAYGYDEPHTRAQYVAAIRAMHSFVRKFPRYALTGGKGRASLFLYDTRDPQSVALRPPPA